MMSHEPEDDEGETRKGAVAQTEVLTSQLSSSHGSTTENALGSDQVEEVHSTVDDSPLDEDDLFDLLEQMLPVSAKWKAIGVGLRLPSALLERIEVDHSSPGERMIRVLTLWLRRNYNMERFGLPSWRTLVKVVAHPAAGGNRHLAVEIARKHPAILSRFIPDSSPSTSPTPPTSSGPGKEKDVSTRLTLKEIAYEMREVKDWFSLGVQLGIRSSKMKTIEMDYPGDVWRCKFELLELWYQDAEVVSWNALAHALTKMGGYDALAKRLRRKIDTHSQTEEHTSSETVRQQRVDVDDSVDDIKPQHRISVPTVGPFCTMWWVALCASVTTVLLAFILWLLVAISLNAFEDLADRPTQVGPPHYLGAKQSFRNLIVIERGNRPSLSELHYLIIPGQKEVKVIQAVSTKWKKLALELGFELSVVQSIGSRFSDSEEDCELMLRKWLMRQDGTVSWEVLMTALDNIGLYSIADDLEKATGNYWLPSANVIGLATASINGKFKAQLEWKEFGLTMNLHLSKSDICNVTVAAGISGDFRIPSNTVLVSAVYYIQISTDPSITATTECEVEVLNSHSKSSTMRYGFAWNGPPYIFDLGAGDFTSRKLHGKIQLPKTPLVLAAFHVQSSGDLETEYSAHVFSQRKGPSLWKLTVVILPTLLAFEQVVKKRYPLTSQRKEVVKLQFVFDTNETELTLDPEDSITPLKEDWTQKLDKIVKNRCPQTTQREAFIRIVFAQRNVKTEGNWKFVPLKLNKISKQEIDEFHSARYMLPTFQFMLHYSAGSSKLCIWLEESKFILRGAKPPQNFFRVVLDPMRCHRIVKQQDLERVLAEIDVDAWEVLCENLGAPEPVLNQLRFDNVEVRVKKSRCLKAYLNTRTACWEQVVKVVAELPFYNQKLARMIADEHGVHYYYSELYNSYRWF